MSLKQNDKILEDLREQYEDLGYLINSLEDLQKAIADKEARGRTPREYEYIALVRCKLSGEVLGEISTSLFEILEQKLHQLKDTADKDTRQIDEEMEEWLHHKYKDIEYDTRN